MLNSQGYQKDGMREHAVQQYVSRKVPKKYGISICTLRGDNLVHSKGNWLVQDCPTPLPSAVVPPHTHCPLQQWSTYRKHLSSQHFIGPKIMLTYSHMETFQHLKTFL